MKLSSKHKRAAGILVCLLPLYIVVCAELNSTQNLWETLSFIWRRPTVILFNLFFLAALLFALTVLFKKLFVSAIVVGGILYILSLVEYFKHAISASHFIIADITMVGNAADITRFANLSVRPWMVVNFITLAACVWLCAHFKIELEVKRFPIRLSGVLLTALLFWMILSPRISAYVYRAFDVDTQPSTNSFAANEKYANNSFLANLLQSSTETIASIVTEPDDYSRAAISALMRNISPADEGKRPNLVFVACESFSDFRCFPNLDIAEEVYRGFDTVASLPTSATGTLYAPTFGGYTARAEFELMVGLPVKSLQNATIPHYLMSDSGDLYSIARSLSEAGYHTAYIHPFSKSFYNRDRYYTRLGFAEYIFDTEIPDLGVTPDYFGDYISDKTAYDAVRAILTREDGAPSYIFLTTMQNHQPYVRDDGTPELEVYLDAVKTSSDALYDFVSWLEGFEEETILVFVGDHFPFFSSESSFYEGMGLNSANCEILYRQQYIVYGNKARPDIDTGTVFSEFYLPGAVLRAAGAPVSKICAAVLSQMPSAPVYSVNVRAAAENNPLLDLLTYDIVCGKGYALEKPNE